MCQCFQLLLPGLNAAAAAYAAFAVAFALGSRRVQHSASGFSNPGNYAIMNC